MEQIRCIIPRFNGHDNVRGHIIGAWRLDHWCSGPTGEISVKYLVQIDDRRFKPSPRIDPKTGRNSPISYYTPSPVVIDPSRLVW